MKNAHSVMKCTIIDGIDIVSETAPGYLSPTNVEIGFLPRVTQAIANLDGWLESMRQPGGYGGPVAHWWRHSLLFAGPGLDWRYEGILTGYAILYRKTGQKKFLQRLEAALADLIQGELQTGGLKASGFEINPETLGTPHESAAVLGMLNSVDCLDAALRERVLELAESVLRNIIDKLWDVHSGGFNDRSGIPGRVPNKLATLAEALLKFAQVTGNDWYLDYAKACLDDVLRYQLTGGAYSGAVHQYGPGVGVGDGRLFPYYNARCVPGLLYGEEVLGDSKYGQSAARIVDFVERVLEDNRWPQIVYMSGGIARWPSWLAGSADILRALRLGGGNVLSHAAFGRLLDSQLLTGGFPTAEGFAERGSSGRMPGFKEWLDVLPVCGWNDKVLRILAEVLPETVEIPTPRVGRAAIDVRFHDMPAIYEEDDERFLVRLNDRVVVSWAKQDPWVSTQFRLPSL